MWLRAIPTAVLFGIFLFLGFYNLKGVQMLSRTVLFFVPVKYHPHQSYCVHVSHSPSLPFPPFSPSALPSTPRPLLQGPRTFLCNAFYFEQ